MGKNFTTRLILCNLIYIALITSAKGQTVWKTRSWICSFNISSLARGTIDSEVEYVPISEKSTWSMRIFRSIGYIDNWSTLGIGGSYRRFFITPAPKGVHWGIGLNIVGLEESSGSIAEGDIIFFLGLKSELGCRMFLGKTVCLSLRGELFYYLSSEEGNEDYHPVQGFGSIFPGKGIISGLTLSLGFSP